MDSILQKQKRCLLCGATNTPLDSHHVWPGCLRKNSEKYGLKVWLCHTTCHEFGINAVHENNEVNRKVQSWAQKKAMQHYGWTIDQWRELFRKDYRQ